MTLPVPGQDGTAQQPAPGDGADRPGRLLPGWAKVLVVVAHPDDESFGLGAIISQMTVTGAAVHILCYTHGEASTLNENRADLDTEREAELRHASTQLAVASVTLLGYPDGGLAAIPPTALAAHA
jgi:LmbE family N-acetylglucosaminyl deacetylase